MERFPTRHITLSGIITFLLLSCSIVEDSDITSQAQFSALVLQSIRLDQETNKSTTSQTLTLLYDSAKDQISSFGKYHLNRLVAFSIPNLEGQKLKLRGAANAATTLRIYYIDNGKPYFYEIDQGDSAIEFYRFLYNSSGRLAKVTSHVDPIDNKPYTVHTNDTLIYNASGQLTSITRNSPIGSAAGSFTITYDVGSGSTSTVNLISFQSRNFNLYNSCDNDNNNNAAYLCAQLQVQSNTGGGGGNCSNLGAEISKEDLVTFGRTIVSSMSDIRLREGCSCDCAREPDTFYLHPLMILRDAIPDGVLALWVYTFDWWKQGSATPSQSLSKNEVVKLHFNYDK